MNMLKKGPDINLRDIKVPAALQDLYYDLKDRHLLPLVALLIVAILAVPIVLGQSGPGESEEPPAAAVATPSVAASGSGELVAKATPGLRDYRKRLSRMEATNPFKQQYASKGDEESSAAGSAEGGVETGGSTSGSEPAAPTPAPIDDGGEPNPDHLTYYSYSIDVRIVPGSGSQDWEGDGPGKPQVRRNLPELTMLPSRDTPAVVYMGSTKDGKKAVMMVSSNVEAIFGDGKCALGSDSCQLLIMEPGVPTTFVYGGEGRTFKIELLKVHLVETDKLNRAPLGKPKKNESKQGKG